MLIALVSVALLVFIAYHIIQARLNEPSLPRVGKPGLIGYISTALRFTVKSESVLQEGWQKFSGRPFILPTLAGPLVVLGPEHVEVLRKSDDSVFNQPIAISRNLQYEHTMNDQWRKNPYHVNIVVTDVTRAIGSFVPGVLEETELTVQDTFGPLMESNTARIPVFRTLIYMIARISNRTMFGTEMGRNKEYIQAIVNFASTIIPHSQVLKCLPRIMRPAAYWILSSIFGGQKEPKKIILQYLEQQVHEREKMEEAPNNIAEFIIRKSDNEEKENVAMRMMALNFGSIHTTTMFLTQALYELAAMPKSDLESIRAEVIEALDEEGGWNKAATARFRKIDSLLKEIGRVYGIGMLVLQRLTIRDGELEDGTRIPAGYKVSVYVNPAHFNPEVYPHPHVFDPFRFSKLTEKAGADSRNAFAMLDNNYILFGTGRHACPGRFLAAMVLKVIIGHLLLNYDISLPEGISHRPKNVIYAGATIPDPKAELVFTRRPVPCPSD